MALTLYYHPLASYCWKVLIALYESGAPFVPRLIDLGRAEDRDTLRALWPACKFPVLQDTARGRVLPESSIAIEYLAQQVPGAAPLLPADADARLSARLWDRVCDDHLQDPLQKIVGDRLRAEADRDPKGVADARAALHLGYALLEQQLPGHAWLAGEDFSLADCAALPALFYASILEPLPTEHALLQAYFERLLQRTSVQRVLREAQPWFRYFPFVEAMPARFLAAGHA
ncbi:glutathione S-transferase family protein [Pseudorhodoferax sp. Leaf274]|uniref:glutathione S-transferase family protein n=1 Tax=Pseudorhodoferax sp. Leaf274 TaxID=1736318 RepID=UPI000702A581|nr:glutathione S-transferase family protein [Pseudorhodoferax sp. Leaf274]KQP49663.1 glutathione S-transferase [Pseudorhodoferax sp. Leaf274]